MGHPVWSVGKNEHDGARARVYSVSSSRRRRRRRRRMIWGELRLSVADDVTYCMCIGASG